MEALKLKGAIYFIMIVTAVVIGIAIAGCTIVGNEVSLVKQCTAVHNKSTKNIKERL